MKYKIRMGIPEMEALWERLQGAFRSGEISKQEAALYKKWGKFENKTSGAMRIYWVYGPDQQSITIIGLEPHPEDKKNGAYARIPVSEMPPFE